MAPKIAVGYVRCSTDQQGDSPDQQKKEILSFAESNGYRIDGWYEDFGKSGTTFDQRPEFLRLAAAVENHPPFSAVICYDESRWGRAIDSEENTFWRVKFRKCGVEVLLVKTSIDPEHEYAPMLKAFEGVQASQYSKKLSELTMRGAMNNASYSNGGTAPYGYRRVARNLATGTIRSLSPGEWCVKKQEKVIWSLGHETEVSTVKHIFEQRAKGVSYVLIAKDLNDRSVPCAKRGRWRNKDRKWSTGTIKSIIENPAYYGARVYNRSSSSKIISAKKRRPQKVGRKSPTWRNPKSEWAITENAHDPIVPKELWEKANAIGRRRNGIKPNGQSYHSRYLLTGLIRCSSCGFAFQGWSGKVRGKEYLRYIDGGWQSKRVCSFLSIPKDLLEDFGVQIIKQTLSEPMLLTTLEAKIKDYLKKSSCALPTDVERIRQALIENKRRSDNLLRLVEEGAGEVPTARDRLCELEQEKSQLERLLTGQNPVKPLVNADEITEEVSRFINDFEETFEKAPIEERKSLVQKCISEIVVDREKKIARFYVRKVPSAVPEINGLFDAETVTPVMSDRSARNRVRI